MVEVGWIVDFCDVVRSSQRTGVYGFNSHTEASNSNQKESAMKLLCFQCGGHFGLIRHHHQCKSFCKMICLDAFKLGIPPKREKPPDELVELLKYPP